MIFKRFLKDKQLRYSCNYLVNFLKENKLFIHFAPSLSANVYENLLDKYC